MAIVRPAVQDHTRWAQSIREPLEVGQQVERLAKEIGATVSQVIRVAIRRVLKTKPTLEEITAARANPGPKPKPGAKPAAKKISEVLVPKLPAKTVAELNASGKPDQGKPDAKRPDAKRPDAKTDPKASSKKPVRKNSKKGAKK